MGINSTNFVCSTPDINEATTGLDYAETTCNLKVKYRDLQNNIQVRCMLSKLCYARSVLCCTFIVNGQNTHHKKVLILLQRKSTLSKRNVHTFLHIKVNVEFIMDGANPRQGTDPSFPLQVEANPKIIPHPTDAMPFYHQPLCSEEIIYIRVSTRSWKEKSFKI